MASVQFVGMFYKFKQMYHRCIYSHTMVVYLLGLTQRGQNCKFLLLKYVNVRHQRYILLSPLLLGIGPLNAQTPRNRPNYFEITFLVSRNICGHMYQHHCRPRVQEQI